MATITHQEARKLLQLAADAELQPGEQLVLEPHLSECAECRAYARSLEATQELLRRSMHRRWDPARARLSLDKIQKHSRRTSMFNKWTVTFGTLGVITALVAAFAILINEQPRAQTTPLTDVPTLTQTIPPASTHQQETPIPAAQPLLLNKDLNSLLVVEDFSWSPDGKKLVIRTAHPTDFNTDILEIVNADGSGLRQLTDSADVILNWSQDGSQIVFCLFDRSAHKNNIRLYAVSVNDSSLADITNEKVLQYLNGVHGGCNISMSPDRKRLAFSTNAIGGGLYVIDLNGDNYHELVPPQHGAYDVQWSPDGAMIIFKYMSPASPTGKEGLYLVRSDGSQVTPGTSILTLAENATSNGAFSPDGQTIAYVDGNDVFSTSSAGANPVKLAHLPDTIAELVWSPDGTQIAFAPPRYEKPNTDLYVTNADGSNLRYCNHFGLGDYQPRWSPDGQQLAFLSMADLGAHGILMRIGIQDLQPYSEPTPEKETPAPAAKPLVLSGELNNLIMKEPFWSPDGKQIAFGTYNGLHIVNADGSGLRQLVQRGDDDIIVNWSKDGTRLFFCAVTTYAEASTSELFSISMDGTGLTNLTNEKKKFLNCGMVPSPDGKRIIAYIANGWNGWYVWDLNGENRHELTPPNTDVYDFTWSPDGATIVYRIRDHASAISMSTLYQVHSDGSDAASGTSIIPLAKNSTSNAAFSPDGQKIAYAENGDVYVLSSRGAGPIKLAHLPDTITDVEWSPDGAHIAFAEGPTGDNLYVINADGSNLRYYNSNGLINLYPRWSPNGQQLAFVSGQEDMGQDRDRQLLLIAVKDLQPFPSPIPTEVPIPTPIPAKNGWTHEYTATVPITSVNQYTQEEIARILFTKWLNHFKTGDADSQNRLDEYELLKVEIPKDLAFLAQEQAVDFVATVRFSVKPSVYMYSEWNAGNGISTDDIWIRNKFLIIGIYKESEMYSLVIIGTGP